jgi:4-hydroxybenzoate polyprenyltransferase
MGAGHDHRAAEVVEAVGSLGAATVRCLARENARLMPADPNEAGFAQSATVPDSSPAGAARLGSPTFARAYLTTMRPYLLFVSGFTGVLGMVLGPPLPLWPAFILGAVFFLSYGFGQALTDCFQTDTDALSAPYRPLVRGHVRRRDVLIVSLAGLAASGAVLIAFHPLSAALAPTAVAGLATYTWFKRRWWGGPWYNAWIDAALVALGYVADLGYAGRPLIWRPELGWALAVAFFGYANFVLAGYFKDIEADRATGYRTFPVVFGRRAAAWASDGLAVAALVSLAGLGWTSGRGTRGIWLVFAAAAVLATLVAQPLLHRVRRDDEAHRSIELTVHAHLLLTAAGTAALAPAWAPGLAAGYVAFLAVMRARPMKEQV